MKFLVDAETDKVIGASMCGPDAPEIMQAIAIGLKCEATKAQFDSTKRFTKIEGVGSFLDIYLIGHRPSTSMHQRRRLHLPHRLPSPRLPHYFPFKLQNGYVSVNDSELIYYFVESQGRPRVDPLILYINGGPGCSALNGLFYQIGSLALNVTDYNGGLPSVLSISYSLDQVVKQPHRLCIEPAHRGW